MPTENRYLVTLRRMPPFLIALLAQILVSVLFTPWSAATDAEFYEGAKHALVLALIVHVLIRFVWPRWQRASMSSGSAEPQPPELPTPGPWKLVMQAFIATLAITLAFALALDRAFIGVTTAIFLCVVIQQLAFASAAFSIQAVRVRNRRVKRTLALMFVCAMALYFSVVIPALLRQTASRIVVPNDATDMVYAIPVILVAILGAVRIWTGGR